MKSSKKANTGGGLLSCVVNILELPPELILNLPLITLTGSNNIAVENYISLIEYSSDIVRISTSVGKLKISGNNLKITEITNDKISINGNFCKLEYEL
jgi:sporulation protein YqfC